MANSNITDKTTNIYATIRKEEHEHLRQLFKLGEALFDKGFAEGWCSHDDHTQFHTYIKPARELQKEALARIIPLMSKVIGNGRFRISPNDYVSFAWLIDELSSFTTHELEIYQRYRVIKL